jgi:hypothetical protein
MCKINLQGFEVNVTIVLIVGISFWKFWYFINANVLKRNIKWNDNGWKQHISDFYVSNSKENLLIYDRSNLNSKQWQNGNFLLVF